MQSRKREPRSRQTRLYERRFAFERLEDRQLMALTTSLDRGALTITGDADADDIAIVGTARAGELVVTGRNGTLVNGVPNGSATAFPVFQPGANYPFAPQAALVIDLAGGDDTLSMDNAYIRGSIRINTGDGDDIVTLGESGEVSPTGDLTIDAGAGNDVVSELNYAVFVSEANLIELGDGHDIATLIGASATRREVRNFRADAIGVNGGNGSDSILCVGLTAVGYTRIDGGLGANSMAVLFSAGSGVNVYSQYDPDTLNEPGRNTIYLDTVYAQTHIGTGVFASLPLAFRDSSLTVVRCQSISMNVALGYGRNEVNLYGNTVIGRDYNANPSGEPIIVRSAFTITGVATGSAALANVSMSYNVVNELFVTLTNSDDSLSLAGNIVRIKASLDGRLGRNVIRESYNYWASLNVQNFG